MTYEHCALSMSFSSSVCVRTTAYNITYNTTVYGPSDWWNSPPPAIQLIWGAADITDRMMQILCDATDHEADTL